MEKEYFFSGYCRATDQSRTVCAEFADSVLTFADCNYPDCPYMDKCTIAGQIKEKEGSDV